MKSLYYATFEKGISKIVKSVIKKLDKSSVVKKLYDDSVLFVGSDVFKSSYDCFKSLYFVLDNIKKTGIGAVNVQMKHLLEKKDLKVYFPREVTSFKLTFTLENTQAKVDDKLKKAVETRLMQLSKRRINYSSQNAELVLLSKADGECLFMKKVFKTNDTTKFDDKITLSADLAYALCYLSEPASSETVVDPFAGSGKVAYIRSLCFKKSNMIANERQSEYIADLKKKAKSLKEKQFSVMNYDFLDEKFPIHFIDKVISIIPSFDADNYFSAFDFYEKFFDKLYNFKIKIIALCYPKNDDISEFIDGKFTVEAKLEAGRKSFVKLKYRG